MHPKNNDPFGHGRRVIGPVGLFGVADTSVPQMPNDAIRKDFFYRPYRNDNFVGLTIFGPQELK
jgi:hypothetical protein